MINNFYTLQALVREWQPDLTGCTVGDAFSQVKDELTLAFAHPEQEWMLRCSVQAPFLFIFRSAGYSKARRNVATLFEEAFDRQVRDVHIAERDRMIFLELEGGWRFQLMLFGTRANVFLVDDGGRIVEAFRSSNRHRGEAASEPRPAPMPDSFEAFEERWRAGRNKTEQALAGAMTLFDRTLAAETMHRASVAAEAPEDCTEADRRALFEAAQALRRELADPAPRVYWGERFAEAFSLIPLQHRADEGEAFETVDEAARVYVRRRLAEEHFRRLYEPLEEALSEAAEHYRRSADRMLEELTSPSRAERYERWGHLLMAAPDEVPPGAEEVELPDLFEEGEPVTIPLEPGLSPIENAQRYYDKARRTRTSREKAEERLVETEEKAEKAAELLEALRAIDSLSELKKFRKEKARRLAPFLQQGGGEEIDRLPFRRFALEGDYEVWVGKNARQNDELTFHHAQKYDLWMHARNMPGSHTVLRLPNRDAQPPKRVIHQAASIAAYYSKGRGSKLVPVMVTERKYVRSPSGAPPGAVRVEREEVVLVEPRLPE